MIRRIHRLLVALLPLAVAVAGCSSAKEGLILSTDSKRYQPGGEIEVTLVNNSDESVGSNICFAFLTLEKRARGTWGTLPADLSPGPDVACTSELRLMQSGDSASGMATLPRNLEAGIYRLTTEVEVSGEREKVTSDDFRVR